VLLEVVDAADSHLREHRTTVQAVLDELGAGGKPRVVAYNKSDLAAAHPVDGDQPSPIVGEAVFVSALTGFGLEALRGRLSDVLASLWEAVDVVVPYAAGELLARVRERGTVDITYRARDVRVHGRVTPSLAAALRLAGDQWRAAGADRGAEPA